MRTQPWILATLLASASLCPGASASVAPLQSGPTSEVRAPRETQRADRLTPDTLERAPRETYVDLPCDTYLPGKADPQEWMSTATLARVTYDGFNYQYGYDPMAQSYDVVVSGLATQGILIQETVGVVATRIPESLEAGQIVRVEIWFAVPQHNLYPNEGVGITALERGLEPNSSLDAIDMQRLYDDARGFSGELYVLEHFPVGAHAIDLGLGAVQDFSDAITAGGWFGVGFAADGWDLSGSDGQTVFWEMAGGGGLPEDSHPFFRVYYNAPPAPFSQLSPTAGEAVAVDQPELRWSAAADPNGDSPIEYTLRLGAAPDLAAAVEIDAGISTSATAPFPLALGTYYWEVLARDPMGATRSSGVSSFEVVSATDAPPDRGSALGLTAAPNPFNPRTTLRFELDRATRPRLEIFDARGRRVRELELGHRTAGVHEVSWDGRDETGRDCASGAYLVRLRAEGASALLRIALVR